MFEPHNLVHLLRHRAVHQTHQSAFTFLNDGDREEVSLTYGELDQQARSIAALLQTRSNPEDRVLLLYAPGLEYLAAFFGCLYAGTIAVPTYPPRRNQTLRSMLSIAADSQATIALTTASILSQVQSSVAQESDLKSLSWLSTDALPAELGRQWQEPAIDSKTLAFLQYTSGSTALPKGVKVSHGNLLANHRMMRDSYDHPAHAPFVSWLPLFHDMGLIGNVLQSVYLGVRCILMSPLMFLQKPFRWLQAISRYKAYVSGGPNFAYDLCTRRITIEQRATLDLSHWGVAFNGSEQVRSDTLERFSKCFEPSGFRAEAFAPCYGLAEATLFVAGNFRESKPRILNLQGSALEHNCVALASPGDQEHAVVSCGYQQRGQLVAIVNPETLLRCRPDEVGEIWVSGPNVAQGYWDRLEETEHSFRAFTLDSAEGPFLRTGDLGFLRDEQLFVTGRLKDLIVIDGSNHYPQDIEQTVAQSHPSIVPNGVAAFSISGDDEERLVVMAEIEHRHRLVRNYQDVEGDVTPNHHPLDAAVLIKAIRHAVTEEEDLRIHAVSLLRRGSLPKTSSGKLRRRACRDEFIAGTMRAWDGTT